MTHVVRQLIELDCNFFSLFSPGWNTTNSLGIITVRSEVLKILSLLPTSTCVYVYEWL